MGLVSLDVDPHSGTLPTKISLTLLNGATALSLTSGGTIVYYSAAPGMNRISAQFDATDFPTGSYDLTAVVGSWWPSGDYRETRISVRAMIVNHQRSGFGSGWSVAGVQRLYMPNGSSGSATFVDGANVVTYPNCGTDCWTVPGGESSTISRLSDGTVQRRYLDGSVATFNTSGLMTQAQDRLGITTSFGYDGYQRLSQITDPAGQVTTIAWSGAPGVASVGTITTPGGRTSIVRINAAGQLSSISDPDGVTALNVSYQGNAITSATDRIGGTTDFAYDQYGGLTTVTGPLVDTQDRGVARSTTTYGSREIALLPASGYGSSASPAASVSGATAWLRVRTQRGDSTRILANGAGDATSIVTRNAQGKLEWRNIDYNSGGQPIRTTTSSGAAMRYGWNGATLDTLVDQAADVTTVYSRNSFGQVLTADVDGRRQETNTYTTDGRSLLATSTAGDASSSFTYDAYGRIATMVDGEQHTRSIAYEQSGYRNTATVTVNGQSVQFAYDGYGRARQVTDPLARTTGTVLDSLNRVRQVTAPDNAVSTWAYNDAARSYTFTDAKAQSYTTTLNAAGAPVTTSDVFGVRRTIRYDSDGNVYSVATNGGRTVTTTSDAFGRPTQRSAGGLETNIAYDTASKWVAYSNAESVDTTYLDTDGRVAKRVAVRNGTPFVMQYDYGDLGERRQLGITSPAWGNAVKAQGFEVDSLGRLKRLWDFGGKATSITYNRDHQPATITVPTGTTSTQLRQTLSYDGSDLLASTTMNYGRDALDWYYGHDALGRITGAQRGESPTHLYRSIDYDLAGRLSHWSDTQYSEGDPVWICPDPYDELSCYNYYPVVSSVVREESYTYDAVGNRTDRSGTPGTGNRMSSFNGYTMTYDDDGNLLTKSGNGVSQSFTWNAFGQLASVTTNGVLTSFGYDGMGNRVRKTSSGVTTYYLYDGDDLVMQLDGAGQPQLEFSYYPGIDNPHAVRNSATGAVYYYTTGITGSVTALVNQSNQVVNRYDYTPFGATITASEQIAQPFRFTGRQLDSETGLYYYRARYYDPTLARFISEDPIGLAGGVNAYAYVRNDPVNHADPRGLWCISFQLWFFEVSVGSTCERADDSGDGSRPAASWPSNTSDNFGNPDARGAVPVPAPGDGTTPGDWGGPSSPLYHVMNQQRVQRAKAGSQLGPIKDCYGNYQQDWGDGMSYLGGRLTGPLLGAMSLFTSGKTVLGVIEVMRPLSERYAEAIEAGGTVATVITAVENFGTGAGVLGGGLLVGHYAVPAVVCAVAPSTY